MPSYKTVAKRAEAEFTEKRSRFIGYVCPVENEEQANAFITEIKQKHWDARHNVYAYILKDGNFKKYSDDGEPQGTAGMPVLEVIEKSGLSDVCVVVTRYFGGILLGGGGLFRAYTKAAKLGLEAAGAAEMALCTVLNLECDYAMHQKIVKLIEDFGGSVISEDFTDCVSLSFYVVSDDEDKIAEKIYDLSGGKITAQKGEKKYLQLKK